MKPGRKSNKARSAMWTPTPFDAPENQMHGVTSDKDRQFWGAMEALFDEYPHSIKHVVTHWPAYIKRISLTRFLAHYEIFRETNDIPGGIVELEIGRAHV